MKRPAPIRSGLFALGTLLLACSGCVVAGGRVSGGAAIYYGPFHLWFYDHPWLDGGPRWHGSILIAPPPVHFGGPYRGPHLPNRPRPHLGRGP